MQASVLVGSNGQRFQLPPYPMHSGPIFSGIVSIVKGVRGTTGDQDCLLSHSAKRSRSKHAAMEIHIGIQLKQYKGKKNKHTNTIVSCSLILNMK